MQENDGRESHCRGAELQLLLCCDLFGQMETVRLLQYARALREECAALEASAKSRKPC